MISRNRGFTLLEAIVSLTLFTLVSSALFAWINTSLISAQKIEEAQQRSRHVANALEYMQTINPMKKPTGDVSIGGVTYRWQASLVEPDVDGVNQFGSPGFYRVGLYRVLVSIWEAGALSSEFSVRLVGYRKDRHEGELF